MEKKLEKKTILITGGTKGIGKGIANHFAKTGHNLVLSYKSDDIAALKTKDELSSYKNKVLLFKGDISEFSISKLLIEKTIEEFGTIDVIVNNAAVNRDKPFHSLTEEDWDVVINTNLKGSFLLSQLGSKFMLNNKDGGHIIFIGSTTGIQGRKNGVNYCASKAGILVMTKCLALELAPKIKVNCVIPGLTWTEESEERFNLAENSQYEIDKREIPMNRIGRPNDVANTVSYLVEQSSYITGQKFIVDGGEYMY